jgi:hypothetical protein
VTDKPQRFPLRDEELDAAMQECVARTHGLLLRSENGHEEIASSVAVQIGSRFFLATAGHVAESEAEIEVIRKPSEPRVSGFVRRCGINGEVDVGLLEVTQGQASVLGPFQGGAEVFCHLDLSAENHVIVTGFPAADCASAGPKLKVSVPTATFAETIPLADWPRNVVSKPEPETDIFMRYPEEGRLQTVTPESPFSTRKALVRPTAPPEGLSGGGIWLVAHRENRPSGLWYPSSQLVGLQVAWYKGLRVLLGVSASKWLEFVRDHYPDLGDDIQRIIQRTAL